MYLQKQVLSFLLAICCLSFTKHVVQGATPGKVSKEMCKSYSKQIPESYSCPFLKKSLAIGNQFAENEEFPHMVLLGYKTDDDIEWKCSASLISDQYVLAAAHCLTLLAQNTNASSPPVARLGVTDLEDTQHLQEIKVAELLPHPEFKSPSAYNDIGLVKLEKKVDISVHTRPACLFTEKDIGGQHVINSGWGSTEFGGDFNNRLQKVVLELYDEKDCNKTYHRSIERKIHDGIRYSTMVCAGTKSLITYQPQSGGPLLIIHKDDGNLTCMYDIVGVASFGKPGLTNNVPSVYSRVSSYIKWIEDTVWK